MSDKTSEFIPTSSSLLVRIKDWNDAAGWQLFCDTYRKLIYNTAIRAGLADAEAQDVVQDTFLSVAKKMPEFEYDAARGSFKGWLLQLTGWRIKNQLKKRLPAEPMDRRPEAGTSSTSTARRVPDPASLDMTAVWDEEWQKNLLDAAIERVKQKANPRHYEIFYLHAVKKLPAAQVAKTLNVNVAQVYLANHRVAALVKKEVRRLERELI
ncbi:RNA polymerase, sigma-24 subunit, ECF subfamily [Verrucomicrobia bacterium]|nr:RNA polymerase, sigma-24 subunit, ECF subfamily [Verrucomicrobiota bacterium]